MAVLVPGHEFIFIGVLAENRRRVNQNVRSDDIFHRIQDCGVCCQITNPLETKMTLALLLGCRSVTEMPVQIVMKTAVVRHLGWNEHRKRIHESIAAIG